MKALGRSLSKFFHQGFSDESLGLFRIYFGCLLFFYHIPQFATLVTIDPFGPSFHYLDPIWYFDLLGVQRVIPWLSFVAAFLLMASTVTFTIGKWTRASIVMVLLCIFYLKGVRDSVTGDVHHRYVALVQILFLLLLSRCGEVLSYDGRRKGGGQGSPSGRQVGQYAPRKFTWRFSTFSPLSQSYAFLVGTGLPMAGGCRSS